MADGGRPYLVPQGDPRAGRGRSLRTLRMARDEEIIGDIPIAPVLSVRAESGVRGDRLIFPEFEPRDNLVRAEPRLRGVEVLFPRMITVIPEEVRQRAFDSALDFVEANRRGIERGLPVERIMSVIREQPNIQDHLLRQDFRDIEDFARTFIGGGGGEGGAR